MYSCPFGSTCELFIFFYLSDLLSETVVISIIDRRPWSLWCVRMMTAAIDRPELFPMWRGHALIETFSLPEPQGKSQRHATTTMFHSVSVGLLPKCPDSSAILCPTWAVCRLHSDVSPVSSFSSCLSTVTHSCRVFSTPYHPTPVWSKRGHFNDTHYISGESAEELMKYHHSTESPLDQK